MIEVEAPDGTIVEFPDGTANDVMRSAMQKRWGSPQAPAVEQPNTLVDMGKSAVTGLGNAAVGMAGLAGDVGSAWNWVGDKLTNAIVGDDPKFRAALEAGRKASAFKKLPGSAEIKKDIESVTGEFHKPQTTAGEYARTAAEFLPGLMAGPGGLVRKGLSNVVAPAVASEAAGQFTEDTAAEPWARLAGGVAGGLAVPSAVTRAITPFPADPARMAHVGNLQAEGVPLSAGQITGSKGLQYAESMLGDIPFGSRNMRDLTERQGDAFSTAAMRRIGEDAPATPDNMAAAHDRITDSFRDISSRNQVVADAQFAQDFQDTLQRYARKLPSQQREHFANVAGDLLDRMSNGQALPGRDYQMIRSDMGRRAHSATDADFSGAMRGLRDALDNAFSRQVAPEDAAGLRETRRQYGNMKTLEKAVTGAGEQAAYGRLSPAQLRNAAATGKSRGAYSRGQGDFAGLARSGQAVMTPLPNSGTAQRNWLMTALTGGAGTAFLADGGVTAATVFGVPAAASRALLSRPGQAYLSNQMLAGLRQDPRSAIIAALLGDQAGGGSLAALPSP